MTMGLTGMKRLRRMADLFTAKDGDPQTGLYSSSVSRSLDPFTNPPVIITLFRFTQQPASQSVTSGNTATFSVAATGGTPPYSYQWQLDSGSGFADITGATSASYETDELVLGDDGNEYRCVVTDDASAEITSNAALLTVVASGLLLMTGDNMLLMTGDRILLEVQ